LIGVPSEKAPSPQPRAKQAPYPRTQAPNHRPRFVRETAIAMRYLHGTRPSRERGPCCCTTVPLRGFAPLPVAIATLQQFAFSKLPRRPPGRTPSPYGDSCLCRSLRDLTAVCASRKLQGDRQVALRPLTGIRASLTRSSRRAHLCGNSGTPSPYGDSCLSDQHRSQREVAELAFHSVPLRGFVPL
jgi:hypothetical protein